LVGVGVGEKRLIEEQPLALGNSSVSQLTRMQRGKNGKRDLDTVAGTSNKSDIHAILRKAGLIF
jgi:hypothetical protein